MQIIRSIILVLGFVVAGGVAAVGQDSVCKEGGLVSFTPVTKTADAKKWLLGGEDTHGINSDQTQEARMASFNRIYGKNAAQAVMDGTYELNVEQILCTYPELVSKVELKDAVIPLEKLKKLCAKNQPLEMRSLKFVTAGTSLVLQYYEGTCSVKEYSN